MITLPTDTYIIAIISNANRELNTKFAYRHPIFTFYNVYAKATWALSSVSVYAFNVYVSSVFKIVYYLIGFDTYKMSFYDKIITIIFTY